MAPLKITVLDLKELTEIEIACDCGASIRFPIPLKNELPEEMVCLGCKRPLWARGGTLRNRIVDFLAALERWKSFSQSKQHFLSLRLVLPETTEVIVGQQL
jgi:hypothetical protein